MSSPLPTQIRASRRCSSWMTTAMASWTRAAGCSRFQTERSSTRCVLTATPWTSSIDRHGLKLHDERQLQIDEHATRHRFALSDSFGAGGVPQHERLFQRFGWADPDKFVPCPSLSGPQPSLRRPRLSLSPSLP